MMYGGDSIVIEKILEELESRSIQILFRPALPHDAIDGFRDGGLFGHTIPFQQLLTHFVVRHARVRHLAFGKQFVEQDAKRPNIRFGGETTVGNGLRSGPFEEDMFALLSHVSVLGYEASQFEVTHLGRKKGEEVRKRGIREMSLLSDDDDDDQDNEKEK